MDTQISASLAGAEPPGQRIPLLSRLPLARTRRWLAYGVAVALSLLGLGVRLAVGDALPTGFPYITFFPAVIVTAFLFGMGPGILAGVLSGMLSWWFFIPPFDSFALPFTAFVALAFYVLIVTVDITLIHWMQTANHDLARERRRSEQLADTREILFKELQHRVGNNLQMVGSLIALQKRRMDDPAAKAALDEASRRLGLVGRIQRQLYDPAGAQLSLAAYIDQICQDVIDASSRDGIEYEFSAEVDTVLPPEKAIPTALVVAEAITNAIEHGFADADHGKVKVTVARVDQHVAVTIADNGKGVPLGFDANVSESLGLKIARTLAQSLGGTFSMTSSPLGEGAVARLEIAVELPDPVL